MSAPVETPTTVGSVLVDGAGQRWVCRMVHPSRGPLYALERVTGPVPSWVMSSVEELADQGIELRPVEGRAA